MNSEWKGKSYFFPSTGQMSLSFRIQSFPRKFSNIKNELDFKFASFLSSSGLLLRSCGLEILAEADGLALDRKVYRSVVPRLWFSSSLEPR